MICTEEERCICLNKRQYIFYYCTGGDNDGNIHLFSLEDFSQRRSSKDRATSLT
jgi:hypothetical protein